MAGRNARGDSCGLAGGFFGLWSLGIYPAEGLNALAGRSWLLLPGQRRLEFGFRHGSEMLPAERIDRSEIPSSETVVAVVRIVRPRLI